MVEVSRAYLAPDIVLSIILDNTNKHEESVSLLFRDNVKLILSDLALFEAMISIDYGKDTFLVDRLIQLLNKSEWLDTGMILNTNIERIRNLRKTVGLE
jgi:hypothetical protein